MNATNFSLMRGNRYGSLSLVLAVHALLAIVLIYAVRMPVRHKPVPDIAVNLLADSPPATHAPLPAVKHLPAITLPAAANLPPLQIDVGNQVAVVPAAATPAPPPAAHRESEAPTEPAKAPVRPNDDAGPTADASAAGNPKPLYPKVSRALAEEGRVLLDVYVLADGTVGDIRIHQSSGFERLDDSALRAVRQWHFKPARQAGRQIAMWYVQPITFNLRNASPDAS